MIDLLRMRLIDDMTLSKVKWEACLGTNKAHSVPKNTSARDRV